MESFIRPANIKLLRHLFRTLPEIEEFDGLFNDYLTDFQHEKQPEDELMYSEIRISIEFVKALCKLAKETVQAEKELAEAEQEKVLFDARKAPNSSAQNSSATRDCEYVDKPGPKSSTLCNCKKSA